LLLCAKPRQHADGEAGRRRGVATLAAPDFVERGLAEAAAEDAVEFRDAEGEAGGALAVRPLTLAADPLTPFL
jgi:hypothetical protein